MISTLSKALSLAFSRIQASTPISCRPTSPGPRSYRGGEPPDRQPRVQVPAGPAVREHRPRRRNQPQTPLEDAGPPSSRRCRKRQVTVGRVRHKLGDPFFVLGDPEPDRAGRDLSAPRSSARPLHVQGLRPPSRPSPRSSRSPGEPRRSSPRTSSFGPLQGRADSSNCSGWSPGRVPVTDFVIKYTLALVRQIAHQRTGAAEVRPRLAVVGAGPRAVQYLILGKPRPGQAWLYMAGRMCSARTSRPWRIRCCGIAS